MCPWVICAVITQILWSWRQFCRRSACFSIQHDFRSQRCQVVQSPPIHLDVTIKMLWKQRFQRGHSDALVQRPFRFRVVACHSICEPFLRSSFWRSAGVQSSFWVDSTKLRIFLLSQETTLTLRPGRQKTQPRDVKRSLKKAKNRKEARYRPNQRLKTFVIQRTEDPKWREIHTGPIAKNQVRHGTPPRQNVGHPRCRLPPVAKTATCGPACFPHIFCEICCFSFFNPNVVAQLCTSRRAEAMSIDARIRTHVRSRQ